MVAASERGVDGGAASTLHRSLHPRCVRSGSTRFNTILLLAFWRRRRRDSSRRPARKGLLDGRIDGSGSVVERRRIYVQNR